MAFLEILRVGLTTLQQRVSKVLNRAFWNKTNLGRVLITNFMIRTSTLTDGSLRGP
jgi:hypothetical protein